MFYFFRGSYLLSNKMGIIVPEVRLQSRLDSLLGFRNFQSVALSYLKYFEAQSLQFTLTAY